MGRAIVRLGDMSTGHDGYPGRPNNSASPDVFVNGIPMHRIGDTWPAHSNGSNSHSSVTVGSGQTIFCNGMGIALVGDMLDCGDTIAEGSPNSFCGG